jgi:RNA polymerase sigma-70 factor (ECF subfamily)
MKASERNISAEIIASLSRGDQHAFRHVYDFYKDRLYYFLLKFCKDPDVAEELMQSFFVKLWEKRKTLRSDTNFEAFLFTIAKHHAFDYLKSRSREQLCELHEFHSLIPSLNLTEQAIFFQELQSITTDAIESLPEKRQIIFRMQHEEGLNVAQIAEMLDISPNTVKVQLSKAVKAIRAQVQSKGEVILALLMIFDA